MKSGATTLGKLLGACALLFLSSAYAGPEKFISLHPRGFFFSQALGREHFARHGAGFGANDLREYLSRIVTLGQAALRGHFPLKIWKQSSSMTEYRFFERSTGVYAAFAEEYGFTLTAYKVDSGERSVPNKDLFWESIAGKPPRNWPTQPDEAVVREWMNFFLGADGVEADAVATAPTGPSWPYRQLGSGADLMMRLHRGSAERLLDEIGEEEFMRRMGIVSKDLLRKWLAGAPLKRHHLVILRQEFPEVRVMVLSRRSGRGR